MVALSRDLKQEEDNPWQSCNNPWQTCCGLGGSRKSGLQKQYKVSP